MMTTAASLLGWVTVPAGTINGGFIDSFRLTHTPITNAQYRAHVDQYRAEPFVMLVLPQKRGEPTIVTRGRHLQELVGSLQYGGHRLFQKSDPRDPQVHGLLVLFELKSDLSPSGFDGPNQPVVNVSWFHALEYCLGNGLTLPSDDQWEYAGKGGRSHHQYGTRSGRLTPQEAHFGANATAPVASYPPNGYGLYDMTGNVNEWTDKNPDESQPYGLRGGCYFDSHLGRSQLLLGHRLGVDPPQSRKTNFGFRAASPV